jgi:hypothetical protein
MSKERIVMRGRYALPFLALLVGACERKGLDEDYSLIGTAESKVPVILQQDQDCTHTLRGGDLQLNHDRSYNSKFDVVIACTGKADSAVTDLGVYNGHYRIFGDTVAMFTPEGQVSGIGVRKGDTLTVGGPSQTVVYIAK